MGNQNIYYYPMKVKLIKVQHVLAKETVQFPSGY